MKDYNKILEISSKISEFSKWVINWLILGIDNDHTKRLKDEIDDLIEELTRINNDFNADPPKPIKSSGVTQLPDGTILLKVLLNDCLAKYKIEISDDKDGLVFKFISDSGVEVSDRIYFNGEYEEDYYDMMYIRNGNKVNVALIPKE